MVGKAEEQLTNEGIPYEVGIAHYNELAKGQVRLNHKSFLAHYAASFWTI